ncbi:hypothetical protein [Sphingomonas montana]|uniref:hypothetical protein n=1 Tax=Sphingomonas montana TaxID=1843236 RepID=UPI0009701CB6|nr:hypothetical protein [Sphingomonas montana]
MILTATLLIAAAVAPARDAAPPMIVTRTMIRQSTTIRVPTRPAGAVPVGKSPWRERHGPKCVAMERVAVAAVVAEDSVDLLLRGGDRVRAHFEDDCPNLDYYRGFYIRPGPDGRICADRDSVQVRSGGECRIERFRALELRGAKTKGGGLVARIRRRLGR